ncbi:MAG: hypothetical protein H7329_07215 [Opitutaceae bacterium]|nr:hypothetical protein [Cytophagales bacterium]
MKFEYPVKITGETPEEIELKVAGLMGGQNHVGFFPLGRLNNWHGGIHIEGHNELLAIADGRVIAYRMPKKYLVEKIGTIEYEYSYGFVLIQHDYKSPQGLEITFYSLYHHLASYEEIIKDKKVIPDFIEKKGFKVKGNETKTGVTGKGAFHLSSLASNATKVFILNNTQVTAGPIDKDYRKITGTSFTGEKYIKADKLVAAFCDTDFDSVKNCDKPIKAGELVSYTGMYGFPKNKDYRASHIEVFTADNVAVLLKGIKEDKDESQHFLQLKKGTELRKASPYTMKKGWNIKVVLAGTEYSQIVQCAVEKTVKYDDLIDKGAFYNIKASASFEAVNKEFMYLLNANTKLDHVSREDLKEGIVIVEKRRKVRLDPLDDIQYWIKNDKIPEGLAAIKELKEDLVELFLKDPTGIELKPVIKEDIIIRKNSAIVPKIAPADEWYFLKCSYLTDGVRDTPSGWIKIAEVPTVSAFDWGAFGFKMLDNLADIFVYDLSQVPDDLKKEIDKIDNATQNEADTENNKKGKLTTFELRSALAKTNVARGLSHLVCKHTNEWACNTGKVKGEVETYLNNIIKDNGGIDNSTELEDTKNQMLDSLELRLPKLNIWEHIKDGPIITDPPTPPPPIPRKFSSVKEVYHFHPIAFVEHMKRMEKCYCERDITVEIFEEIFGKGPWFTSTKKFADMSKYPDVYKSTSQRLVNLFNKAMSENGINTCFQKAHFISQCAHETDSFKTTQEYDEGLKYDPGTFKAKHDKYKQYLDYLKKYGGDDEDNQTANIDTNYESCKSDYDIYEKNKSKADFNLQSYKTKHDKYVPFLADKLLYTPYKSYIEDYNAYVKCLKMNNKVDGDGIAYKGKGFLQLTWKCNYEEFKKEKGINCVTNPTLIASNLENAINVSVFHWIKNSAWGNLNLYANKDDLIYITYGINGGLNGLQDRYTKLRKALDSLICKNCGQVYVQNLGNYTYDKSEVSQTKFGKKHKNYIVSELNKLK